MKTAVKVRLNMTYSTRSGGRGGLMVSALDSGPSGLGLSASQGHYVVSVGQDS